MPNTKHLLLSIFLVLFTSSILAKEITGKVVKVTDGDTIQILISGNQIKKIRLAGIDTPERKQAFGAKAKKHLSSLVATKIVSVHYQKKDRYGRIVGKVLLNEEDINLAMVSAGLAWHYKKYAKEQSPIDRKLYDQAEKRARNDHKGLWSDPAPIPPWEWRKNRQSKKHSK